MRIRILSTAIALAFVTTAFAATTAPTTKPPTIALVRGTIASFDGKVLKIKPTTGADVSGVLPPQPRISAVETRTLAQLKPTDFVGVTAVDGPNGTLIAEEIHVIPVAGLGEGHYDWDHHPDGMGMGGAMRAGSMTNGTIMGPQSSGGSMGAMHGNMSGGGMMSGSSMSGSSMMGSKHAGSMTNGTVVTSGGKSELKLIYRGAEMVGGKCVGHAPATGGCTGTATIEITPKTFIQAIVPAKVEDIKAGLASVSTSATNADGSVVFVSVVVEKNGVKPEF